jgi:hypothetical protein
MKKNSVIFILAAVFIAQVAVVPVFADLMSPPVSRKYSKDVLKKTKMKKGYVRKYDAEYKQLKGIVCDIKLSFIIHNSVSIQESLVKKGDFVKKGEAIALTSTIDLYPDGKIYSRTSGYVINDINLPRKHLSYISGEFIRPELAVKLTGNSMDSEKYIDMDKAVDIAFPEYPEIKLKGYIFRGWYEKSSGRIYDDYVPFRFEGSDFAIYAVALNIIPEKYKEIVKAGANALITASFSSEQAAIIPNEFLYEYKGKKFLIEEIQIYDNFEYFRREVITGESNNEHTEVLYPVDLEKDIVVFKDNSIRDFILKNGISMAD